MLDAEIKRATCRVTCASKVGTGVLVGPSTVLTAFHCVREAVTAGAPIELGFLDAAWTGSATVIDHDESVDACLLRLERNLEAVPLDLTIQAPREGRKWRAFGYPIVKMDIGHHLEGAISQVLAEPVMKMDLDLVVGADFTLTDYAGFSGALLFEGPASSAMLRISVDKAVGAISVSAMAPFLQKNAIALQQLAPAVPADNNEYAERLVFADRFEALAAARSGGYLFLDGAPGIGKSTFCQFFEPRHDAVEVFGTYSLSHGEQNVNATRMAQPEVFYDWLMTTASLRIAGRPGRLSEIAYAELISGTNELFVRVGSEAQARGKTALVFIDALDEAAKLGHDTLTRFLGLLPDRLPQGVVVALTAPNRSALGPSLGARVDVASTLELPALGKDAERAYCRAELAADRSTEATVDILCTRSQGHPLYLRYLIDYFNGGASEDELIALPAINGSIRNYYEALWPAIAADAQGANFLSIMARLRGGVDLQQLGEMLIEGELAVLVSTLPRIRHLLQGNDSTAFYHRSFAEFVLEKTAARELDVQRRLTEYCFSHSASPYVTLNLVYHALRAGAPEQQRGIAACDQVWVDRCVEQGVEPDTLLGDLAHALELATTHGDPVEMVRMLLLSQRLQFRYDTLFAQSASLAAQAQLALGRTAAALQHTIRYGHLIVSLDVALSVSWMLIQAGDTGTARDLLAKVEVTLAKAGNAPQLTVNDFVRQYELRMQAFVLMEVAGDTGAVARLMQFNAIAFGGVRNSVADTVECEQLIVKMYSYFSASMVCLANRYPPVALLRRIMGHAGQALSELILSMLRNYRSYSAQFSKPYDRALLRKVFDDLAMLQAEATAQDIPEPLDLRDGDTLVELGCPSALLESLLGELSVDPDPILVLEEDGLTVNHGAFMAAMAQWRLAAFRQPTKACPASEAPGPAQWWASLDSIASVIAWCDGAGRLAMQGREAGRLAEIWELMEHRVFDPLRFTLEQRSGWQDAYDIPEAVLPMLYVRLTELCTTVFPDRVGALLSFVDSSFANQCGIYSEGFRQVVFVVIDGCLEVELAPAVEDQAFALLQRWRDYVERNVQNRHELVPELLVMIPMFVRCNAQEEASRLYQTVLSVSMGPGWYKEDQLTVMTSALQHFPLNQALDPSVLPQIAGYLERASGEMTFQRYVRYQKSMFLKQLARRRMYGCAVRYFVSQTCGTPEELLAEATVGDLDRISPMRGMRFPGAALDEQAAALRILEAAVSDVDWRTCWALVEIFQFGDERHLESTADLYARMAQRADVGAQDRASMVERIRIVAQTEFDDPTRKRFMARFSEQLPDTLRGEFAEFFTDLTPVARGAVPPPFGATGEPRRAFSAADAGVEPGASGVDEIDEDELYLPGTFGTRSSAREAAAALKTAESLLTRGNIAAARNEALRMLATLQGGGWGIWGNHSSGATRAEDILAMGAADAASLARLYGPLITQERYVHKWRRADYLLARVASLLTNEQSGTVVQVVLDHVVHLVGRSDAETARFDYLGNSSDTDPAAALQEWIVAMLDHPNGERRNKAVEVLQWLLIQEPNLRQVLAPRAFTMAASNVPDAICALLDKLSVTAALDLWYSIEHLPEVIDAPSRCRHAGRMAVLLRIAQRAERAGSPTAAAVRERMSASFQPVNATGQATTIGVHSQWGRAAHLLWSSLTEEGVATVALKQRFEAILNTTCSPMTIDVRQELEGLVSLGVREQGDHPTGRWMALVRHALMVALFEEVDEPTLLRLEPSLRVYNPSPMDRLEVLGFRSPTLDWIGGLVGARRAPAFENATHTYLNLQERFWDGGKWRFLNVTAALSGTRVAAPEPMLGTTFLSTETASSRKALPYETCAAVEIRPALLGMFTPAMVAGSFMQMTGASAGDLARAHWRRDRTPEYQGHLPKSEGCYLAMRTQAIRMPAGHQLIWHWEIDGQYAGVVTRR